MRPVWAITMLHAILYGIVIIVLVVFLVPKSATWLPDESGTGLGTGEGSIIFCKRLPIIGTGKGFPLFDNRLLIKGIKRVIRRPLDTHNVSSGTFYLFAGPLTGGGLNYSIHRGRAGVF